MPALTDLSSKIARSPGDPRVEQEGHSSLTSSDRLARALGWFSFALGAVEILMPGRIAKTLGMEGQEGLIRAYGLREIAAGVPTLSVDKQVGLSARIVGDALDLATLATGLRSDNPKRGNVLVAMTAVAAVTLLDIAAARGVAADHGRSDDRPRDYGDRSGLPKGIEASRGAARKDTSARPEATVASVRPDMAKGDTAKGDTAKGDTAKGGAANHGAAKHGAADQHGAAKHEADAHPAHQDLLSSTALASQTLGAGTTR